jgi:hypothetical protein
MSSVDGVGRFASGSGPLTVSGTALAAGTINGDGDKKITEGAIETYADTLADDSRSDDHPTDGMVVVEHSNSARDAVGEVTESRFNADADPPAVEYEAEIDDPQIARGIKRGRFEVSPRLRYAAKIPEIERTHEGVPIIDADAAGRMIHLSVEAGSRSPGSSIGSDPLDRTTTDAAPFRPSRTTDSSTTVTDMSSNSSTTTDDSESLADLRAKLREAKEQDMAGMVRHYEGRIEDMRAAGARESGTETADLAARERPDAYDDETETVPEYDDSTGIEQAEAIGWDGAADAIRERRADDAGAPDDTTTTDMSPAETAVAVNRLRNKRATARNLGEMEMAEQYEQEIADLMAGPGGRDVSELTD